MQPQPAGAPGTSPPSPADETRALSRITWFAAVSLVAILSGEVIGFTILSISLASGAGLLPGVGIGPSGPNPRELQGLVRAFQYMSTLIPFILLLQFVSVLLLWFGFRGLSRAGAREFSLPSKLILASVVGLALLIPGMVVFFSAMVPLMESLVQHSSAASLVGSFLASGLLLIVGALLEAIGYIGGQMLGIWRLGGRYHQRLLKVGAILFIVPLASIIAPVLVIIGVSGAKKTVGQAPAGGP